MAVFDVHRPDIWRGGLIVASPHSGRDYPGWLRRASPLSESQLRSSEDAFVDRLALPALAAGGVVLTAQVPRAVVDLNRARTEIDPNAVEDAGRCTANPRTLAGLGVIPRVVAQGRPILPRKLTRAEAEARLEAFWQPYHDALAALVDEAHGRFGRVLLVDLHSMPRDALLHLSPRPDAVIGDRHGRSADSRLREVLARALAGEGLRTRLNAPFSGAFVLDAYGRPAAGRHALQLELDRSLYMDEARLAPTRGLAVLAAQLGRVYASVVRALDEGRPAVAAE